MNKILKERWERVDKHLIKHLNKYNRLTKDLKDEIQDIFNDINYTFSDLNKPLSKQRKSKLDRLYQKWNKTLNIPFILSQRIQRALRTKSSNLEMLSIMIEIAYLNKDKELDEIELLKQIAIDTYEQGSKEAGIKPKKSKGWLTDTFLLSLIAMPNPLTGMTWNDYRSNDISYNARQMTNQVSINLQQGKELNVDNPEFETLLQRQQRRYLNKKKGIDKFSGALDNEVSFIVNNVILQSYLDAGIEKVRFISILDEVTSEMCESLDNQIFWIKKNNRFFRYSASAKAKVLFNIKGLQSGVNLPPITDSFHYCRSTIYREMN